MNPVNGKIAIYALAIIIAFLMHIVSFAQDERFDDWGWKLVSGCSKEDDEQNSNVLRLYYSPGYQGDADSVIAACCALAECAYFDRKWDRVVAYFQKAEEIAKSQKLKENVFKYRNILQYMTANMHIKKWATALTIYDRFLNEKEKSSVEVLFLAAVCNYYLNELDQSKYLFENFIKKYGEKQNPGLGISYLRLGEISLNKKNYSEATKNFKIVTNKYRDEMEFYPKFPEYSDDNIADDAQCLIAQCYADSAEQVQPTQRRRELYNQALVELSKIIRFYPDSEYNYSEKKPDIPDIEDKMGLWQKEIRGLH